MRPPYDTDPATIGEAAKLMRPSQWATPPVGSAVAALLVALVTLAGH